MEITYLEIEDVEYLHDLALERYGGLPGREEGKLEAKLAMPMSGFGGYERYPSLVEKAAVYHYYLASGHTFQDGNKRTSLLALFTFLDWNGYSLYASEEEAFEWTIRLADHENRPSYEEAVQWLLDFTFKSELDSGMYATTMDGLIKFWDDK